MTDLSIVDSVGSAGEAALDTVVGGASLAFDSVTRPRRTAGRARRRGGDVTEAIGEVTEDVVDEVSALPERALLAYVRMLRRRARRDDVVGTVSRGVLGALHRPARDWARFFQRLERETTVDRRGRTARSSTRTVRGTARTAARKTARGARRTTATARGKAPARGRRATGTRRRTA
ncbi:MAG TPA: hypothetical protein VFC09_11090 [Candidatus Dormibacteraeota bacterium]|nr:hypothetical protein [Candidatus Dormibacteraeota bacterium]